MGSTTGPFIKVLALTQGMINDGFQGVFGLDYPSLKSFRFQEQTKSWDISLALLAPRLLIENNGNVYLQIRIEKGSITPGAGESIPMDGWEIYHAINKDALIQSRTDLLAFDLSVIPGDIDIERWLAILLATPAEGFAVDLDRNMCVEEGEAKEHKVKIKWREWATKNPQNSEFLERVLKEWPQKLRDKGYNFLGLRFNLPQIQNSSSSDPQSLPVDTRSLVIYQDKNVTEPYDDRNSFLICSGNSTEEKPHSFDGAQFIQSNFVAEALSASGTDVLSGYWVLNSNQVFEKVILARLSFLNETTELELGQPTWITENGKETYSPVYKIHRDFDAAEEGTLWIDPLLPHEFSRFIKAGQGAGVAGDSLYSYGWSSSTPSYHVDYTLTKPNSDLGNTLKTSGKSLPWRQNRAYRANFIVYNIAEHKSIITFNPGYPVAIRADFNTTYKSESEWTKISTGKSPGSFKFEVFCTWHLLLDIVYDEGGFRVKIKETPVNSAATNFVVKTQNIVANGFKELWEVKRLSELKKFFEHKFKNSVISACSMFRKNIEASPQWTLPEEKWLQFQRTALNRQGDLIAGVNYKPPSLRELLEVADLSIPRPRPPVPVEPVNPTSPEAPTNTLNLEWTETIIFTSTKRDRLQVKLEALNNSADDITEGHVEVTFQTAREGAYLFSAIRFPGNDGSVSALEPPDANVTVASEPSLKRAYKATIKFASLAAGSALVFIIEGRTKATAEQEYSLALKENWKNPLDDSDWIESHGQLKIKIPAASG